MCPEHAPRRCSCLSFMGVCSFLLHLETYSPQFPLTAGTVFPGYPLCARCMLVLALGPQLAVGRFALPLPLRREFILPLPLGPGAGLPLPLQRFTLSFVPSPPGESTDRPHLGFRTARRRRRRKNGTKIVGNSTLLLTTIRLPARALVLPLPLRPSLDLPLPLRRGASLPLPPNASWGVGREPPSGRRPGRTSRWARGESCEQQGASRE